MKIRITRDAWYIPVLIDETTNMYREYEIPDQLVDAYLDAEEKFSKLIDEVTNLMYEQDLTPNPSKPQ